MMIFSTKRRQDDEAIVFHPMSFSLSVENLILRLLSFLGCSQNAKLRKNESNTKKEQVFFFVLPSESNFGEATVTTKKMKSGCLVYFLVLEKQKWG